MTSWLFKPGHPMANKRGFVEKNDFYAHQFYTEPDLRMTKGNEVITMNFISDSMEPTRHMCDGKYYTSKKTFREVTKAHGCIEIGNEVNTVTKRKEYTPPTSKRQLVEDIKTAARQLTDGSIPEGERAKIKNTAEIMRYNDRNRRTKDAVSP